MYSMRKQVNNIFMGLLYGTIKEVVVQCEKNDNQQTEKDKNEDVIENSVKY